MSERLKSKYLRKREEISSNSSKYFFAGLLFALFMLFLFYQFRAIILKTATSANAKPTIACDKSEILNYVNQTAEQPPVLKIHEPEQDMREKHSKINSEHTIGNLQIQKNVNIVNAKEIKSEMMSATPVKSFDKTRIYFHHRKIQISEMKKKFHKKLMLN